MYLRRSPSSTSAGKRARLRPAPGWGLGRRFVRRASTLAVALPWIVPVHAPTATAAEIVTPELIQIIDTSQLSPPSPEPAGLAFMPSGTLLISDGDVDERPTLYEGKNVWEITTAGVLVGTFRTTRFSSEPVGLAVNRKTLFISDDSKGRVFRVRPGRDGMYGTKDDKVRWFSTRAFGLQDPEGIAFGKGALFLTDGTNAEVYRVGRGRNGVFDGVPPEGDDRVRHFDVAELDQPDPEGIEFIRETGTLLIVSNRRDSNVIETTTRGELIRVIDCSAFGLISPAGLAYGPRSTDPSVNSLYIADRGREDPLENDGKVYEIAF